MDWACNVSAYTDGRKNILKNTSLVFLHELDLLLVALDESPAYRIEDIAEVELSAVDADDVESPLDVWVQNYGNPVFIGIVVVELRISDHHIPLTRTSLDDRLHIRLLSSTCSGYFRPFRCRIYLCILRAFILNNLLTLNESRLRMSGC